MVLLPEQFNATSHFIDRNVLEARGARIAIECGERKISYLELLQQTNRVGNVLSQLGVRAEERVPLLLADCPEFLYCFFGSIKIGAVAVPINPYLKPSEWEYLLNLTRARVLFISAAFLGQLQEIPRARLQSLREVIAIGGESGDASGFDQLLQSASPELEAETTSRDDAAFWLFSSGSTGSPKACVHLQHDMVVSSELYAKGILQMTEEDRCYSVARLFFAYGLGNAGYFPLAVGGTTILSPERPTPAGIFADIERYCPTLFFSVPTNYAALLSHHREGKDFDLSSVRHAISAGEALPAPVFQRFKERFGVEILDALGSTETLHMVTSNVPGQVRAGSSGRIIPGFEMKIVDESGEPLTTGEIGNLMVKADSTCAGYWNEDEKNKTMFTDGWFHTGDKYFEDEDGYLWYAGRANDLFKVNGRWLSPTEVESCLLGHAAVQEGAVIAREDENGLVKPAAYVVIKNSFQPSMELAEELKAWVAGKLSAYKRPQWIEFLPALPKTATGKLQRYKLREYQVDASRTQSR